MQSTELSKRERRLRAAVVRIEERAFELYPDAGDENARKWARAKRHAFVAGALFWRYKDQQFAVEGGEMRRKQSEADKAKHRAMLDAAERSYEHPMVEDAGSVSLDAIGQARLIEKTSGGYGVMRPAKGLTQVKTTVLRPEIADGSIE